jgi:Protein of Unknown function (DUF2784)
MLSTMYVALDVLFTVVHASLIAFILTGWIWAKSRLLHLVVVVLTFLSWFGLGFFYGFGYCACTDWHWRVKRLLGETDLPNSYVKYYLDRLTGWDWPALFVHALVLFFGICALALSIFLNWRSRRPFSARPDAPDSC